MAPHHSRHDGHEDGADGSVARHLGEQSGEHGDYHDHEPARQPPKHRHLIPDPLGQAGLLQTQGNGNGNGMERGDKKSKKEWMEMGDKEVRTKIGWKSEIKKKERKDGSGKQRSRPTNEKRMEMRR
jgi:hypothetical protein